jgi:hypothetical protein
LAQSIIILTYTSIYLMSNPNDLFFPPPPPPEPKWFLKLFVI